MRNILFNLSLIFSFVSSVSAQTEKAEKIVEFGYEHCSQVLNHTLLALQETEKVSDSKLYVIYYQGNYLTLSNWNSRLKKYDYKYSSPKRGEALIRAKEIGLIAKDIKDTKVSENDIVIINGGFRADLTLELWVVPKNAESPQSTPTLQQKDIKFRKGKLSKPRLCARIYDGL